MKVPGIASLSQLQALLQTAAKSALVYYKAKSRRDTGVPGPLGLCPKKKAQSDTIPIEQEAVR